VGRQAAEAGCSRSSSIRAPARNRPYRVHCRKPDQASARQDQRDGSAPAMFWNWPT